MLVVNNIVKMEWDASQWLEINVKGSDGKNVSILLWHVKNI